MTSTDQVMGVQGYAGSGKTTLLRAAKVGWEMQGYVRRIQHGDYESVSSVLEPNEAQ